MKVVLFCGGFGTRIRDYSEAIPKPMIPVGDRPIVCHVMEYYAQHGHKDFVLCLGYKASSIKHYFLSKQQHYSADLMLREGGSRVQVLGNDSSDWSIGLIDTGLQRSVGERLCAVREFVKDEEMFLANYSDGLTDAPLPEMIEAFRKSGKVACFLAVHPMLTFHLADIDRAGAVRRMQPSASADIWINGGYFIFRREIFDYIQEGEDLVEQPFARLIAANMLMAFRYEGFWRPMDTLRDRQALEEMVERGEMPWKPSSSPRRHAPPPPAKVALAAPSPSSRSGARAEDADALA